MAPPNKWRMPKGRVIPRYDATKERKTDPSKIAYELSQEAASILVYASQKGKTAPKTANGYTARHLVDKGCLQRLPGRNSSYRITLRGEAVVEELQKRKSMAHLFTDRKPPEL